MASRQNGRQPGQTMPAGSVDNLYARHRSALLPRKSPVDPRRRLRPRVERKVTSGVEQGDHHIVVGEVVEAHLPRLVTGRPDAAILEMKDLGDNVFYGG